MIGKAVKTLKDLYGYLRDKASWFVRKNSEPALIESKQDRTLRWFRAALANDISRNFAEGVSPEENPWAPLKYRTGQILVLTGLLLRSCIDAAFRRTRFDRNKLVSSIESPRYWSYHMYGTRRIPARPFYGPRAATVQELTSRFGSEMAKDFLES